MADILSKYVKFVRGTSAAFANLPIDQRTDDTLYFIADEDAVIGELWLGNTLIAKGASEGVAATKLSELLDVDISNVQNNQYLGYDANKGKWVPLSLLITINDIPGLEDILNTKVNKVYYPIPVVDEEGNPVLDENGEQVYEQVEGSLLSPADQDKLDALVITEDGVEISGTVNAANVEDLNIWITKHRDSVNGLLSTSIESKINSYVDLIHSVNTDEFTITANKELQLANIPAAKITNIDTILNDYVLKNDYESKMKTIEEDISSLKQATTWKQLGE